MWAKWINIDTHPMSIHLLFIFRTDSLTKFTMDFIKVNIVSAYKFIEWASLMLG